METTTPTIEDLSNEWMALARLDKKQHFKQFIRIRNIAAFYLIGENTENKDTSAPTAKSALSAEALSLEELDGIVYNQLLAESPTFAVAISQAKPLSQTSV